MIVLWHPLQMLLIDLIIFNILIIFLITRLIVLSLKVRNELFGSNKGEKKRSNE